MWDITVLIKTFRRPEACNRLVSSIKRFYPDLPILILDDSDETCEYGFDIGTSRARNILVDKCQTKYCLILDDDCIFSEMTDLERGLEIAKDYDLLMVAEVENGVITGYKGRFEVEGTTVRMVGGEPFEFINNIFIAKTEVLRKYRWQDDLKTGEHFAFFFTHRGKMKIGYTDEVEVIHSHLEGHDYRPYRDRALNYVIQFMREQGLTKRIDLFGNEINA